MKRRNFLWLEPAWKPAGIRLAICQDSGRPRRKSVARPVGVISRLVPLAVAVTLLARPASAQAAEAYAWKPVAIGGGGFVTGLAMDDQGETRVARTDVHGAYVWRADRDRWAQLVTSASMPDAFLTQNGANEGVYEIAVAPGDPERVYLVVKGQVLRSRDGGASFETAGAGSPFPLALEPNGEFRTYGPFLSVGPSDPDVVLLGTPADGLWRTTDAGGTWARVDTVPPATDLRPEDPGHQGPGVSVFPERKAGRPTGRLWAASPGNGVYVSEDGGARFRALVEPGALQPLLLAQGAFAGDGSFFGVDRETQKAWLHRDGGWEDLTAAGRLEAAPFSAVAVNLRLNQALVFDQGGDVQVSNDGGARWMPMLHRAAPGVGDPPWLRVADQSYFATGPVLSDPAAPDRIWVGAGTGVYYADVSQASPIVDWRSQTRGIEELVATDVAQSPGRPPLFAFLDFGIHVKDDLDTFSTGYGPKERVLIAAQQLATSPSDPDFVATNASDTRTGCCWQDGDAVLAGYSLDAGQSWAKFAVLPQPPGTSPDDPWRMSFGAIAVSAGDTRNIVWEPSYDRAPFYTRDQGASWTRVALEGEMLPFTGSHPTIYLQRKNLAADGLLGGVFYLAHSGGGDNAALAGLWRTQDGGAGWSRLHRGEIAPDSGQAAKLRAMPGRGGDLFFTSAAGGTDAGLRRSRDGGATWARVAGVDDVDDLAFGAPAPGASVPTIYLSGRVGGRYGIWRSTDDARSWRRIGGFPMGSLDQVTVMGADPDRFGRVYVGYMGSGFVYGEPAACAPAPYAAFAAAECSAVE